MKNITNLSDRTKMMLIADVHYGVKSGGDNTINYLSWMDTIDEYFSKMFIPEADRLIAAGEKPFVVVCGDFFDNRISLRIDVMDRATKLVRELAKHLPLVLMAGNHDSYLSETAEVNSLQIFDGIENVYVATDPTRLQFSGITVDAFPWVGDKASLGILLKGSDADIALIHSDINGMRYASNVVITDGVETKGFKGKKLYSGHIHKRQEGKKVTYIGSPYELDRSDMGNVKGIYEIGVSASGKIQESFVENTVSPRFVSMTYGEFVECAENNKKKIEHNYVEITYSKDNKLDVAKIQNNSADYACADINYKFIDEDIELVDTPDDDHTMTILETIEEYIRSIKDITEEQRNFLLAKNKEYLERASK